jgi:pyruvate,water dikinase
MILEATMSTESDTNAAERYGGKAANLLELQAAGFNVPEFVVSPLCIEQAVERLGTPLAVRSSAVCEDGADASFAGQFRSFLNLQSAQAVEQSVGECQASLRAPSVLQYCRKHGVDSTRLRMEVIVQRMIQPELAGVAFTVNPATGDEEVVIEACEGLADGLLSGREQPLPIQHPLLQKYRSEIERLARQIQQHFGAPQDIEFAISEGSIYVLQSRPITRIEFSDEIGQWTNADFRDGGVSSSVCSPLMWSLYQCVWDRTLKDSLRELKLFRGDFQASRTFFGRPYWNLAAVKECLTELPGFVEREFDEDLSVQINYEGLGKVTPLTLPRLVRALPTLLAVRKFLQSRQLEAEGLLGQSVQSRLVEYEFGSGSLEDRFRQLIEVDYFQVECTYFRTIFAASLAKLDFVTSFPHVNYGSLVAGLPPLRHMAPMRAIRALRLRTADDLTRVVDEHRHHYRQGLDVIFPRWDEDRQFVTQMLMQLPPSSGQDPRPAFEAEYQKTRSSLRRWQRSRFDRKLQRLRHILWLREEVRDVSNRFYYLVRKYAIELGRQRQLGDDIFFQTFQQIFSDDRSQIERNRQVYESYRRFKAPNEIGARYRFDRITSGDTMRGIAASPGTVTATACVARTVEDALRMTRGQILVCPFVDPGWTPILDRVGGVVTETGGLLSHAAIICREYGVPAVLGVEEATKRIPNGAILKIDGSVGLVQPLPPTEESR